MKNVIHEILFAIHKIHHKKLSLLNKHPFKLFYCYSHWLFFIDVASLFSLVAILVVSFEASLWLYLSTCFFPKYLHHPVLFSSLQASRNVRRQQPKRFSVCPTHSDLFIISFLIKFALHNLVKWARVTISYIVIISEFMVVCRPLKYINSSGWLQRVRWTFMIYRTHRLCLPYIDPFFLFKSWLTNISDSLHDS